MNKQIKDFNELISNGANYLESELFYSLSTVGGYSRILKLIRNFMASNGIKCYNQDVEKQILHHEFGDRSIGKLSYNEKHFYNATKMLTEFQETGKVNLSPRMDRKKVVFSGPIGVTISSFLNYKRVEEGLSLIRFNFYQRYLFQFLCYCNEKGIGSINDINLTVILHYIDKLSNINPPISIAYFLFVLYF